MFSKCIRWNKMLVHSRTQLPNVRYIREGWMIQMQIDKAKLQERVQFLIPVVGPQYNSVEMHYRPSN